MRSGFSIHIRALKAQDQAAFVVSFIKTKQLYFSGEIAHLAQQ